MPARTLTISIPEEVQEFLQEHDYISPSQIFQQKVYELINEQEHLKPQLERHEKNVARLTEQLSKGQEEYRKIMIENAELHEKLILNSPGSSPVQGRGKSPTDYSRGSEKK